MTSSPVANKSSIDPADWTTLCQSELAALAVDREFGEALSTATQLWNVAAAGVDRRDPTGRASADAQTRAAPASAPPDAGGDAGGELAELRRRLAELERRGATRPGGAT